MTRAIATIDRYIRANTRELLRRHPIDDRTSSRASTIFTESAGLLNKSARLTTRR